MEDICKNKVNLVSFSVFFSQKVRARFCDCSLTAVTNFIVTRNSLLFPPLVSISPLVVGVLPPGPCSRQSPGPLAAFGMMSFGPPVAMAAPRLGRMVPSFMGSPYHQGLSSSFPQVTNSGSSWLVLTSKTPT